MTGVVPGLVSGSFEYDVMVTKAALCAAVISEYITTSCAVERHGLAGKLTNGFRF
jgi:hypothetical protein